MNLYIVMCYVSNWPFPFGFTCGAETKEQAEAQCTLAHPMAIIVRTIQVKVEEL